MTDRPLVQQGVLSEDITYHGRDCGPRVPSWCNHISFPTIEIHYYFILCHLVTKRTSSKYFECYLISFGADPWIFYRKQCHDPSWLTWLKNSVNVLLKLFIFLRRKNFHKAGARKFSPTWRFCQDLPKQFFFVPFISLLKIIFIMDSLESKFTYIKVIALREGSICHILSFFKSVDAFILQKPQQDHKLFLGLGELKKYLLVF